MNQILIGSTTPILQNVIYAVPSIPVEITSGAVVQSSILSTGPFTNVQNGLITGRFIRCLTGDTTVSVRKHVYSSAAPVEPDSPLLDGLVSYWSFDAGWNDLHGTNHLTNHNGVTSVPGKLGNAGDFEASSAQYLSHADPDPLGDEDFTYALWFKRESTGGTMHILSKDHNIARYYEINITNDVIGVAFHVGSSGVGDVVGYPDSNWHFVAVWHDAAANTISVQSDNGNVTTSSPYTAYTAPGTPIDVRIGARQYPGFEQYFDGLIDEVGLWRRVLTADERTQLYNSGNGLAYPFA